VEEEAHPKRDLFYGRVLDVLTADPQAAAHNWSHDLVALNLYRSPDDIYRIHSVFKDIQRRHRLDKPLWLTETNAMPSGDRQAECWQQHIDGWHTTLDQQAAVGVQANALAAAAGYQRMACQIAPFRIEGSLAYPPWVYKHPVGWSVAPENRPVGRGVQRGSGASTCIHDDIRYREYVYPIRSIGRPHAPGHIFTECHPA
jgi:hypothetical protein